MDPSHSARKPRALALALATALVVFAVEGLALGFRVASVRPLGASTLPVVLHFALLALSAIVVVAILRGPTRVAARIALVLHAWLALTWAGLLALHPVAFGYVIANALVALGWLFPIAFALWPHARAGAPRWVPVDAASAPMNWRLRFLLLAGFLALVALAVVITWRSLRG